MKTSRTIVIVRKVYDVIETALWAGMASFVVCFVIFIAPNLSEAARRAESIRILETLAENRTYCEKWGMKRGTHEHTLCTMDLQDLRKKIEQDFAEQGSIF